MGKRQKNHHLVNFGNRLRAFREKANLTQEQIQDATKLPQALISRIETANANPKTATLYKLADFFGQDYQLFLLNSPIPTSAQLQKAVNKYLLDHGINPRMFVRKGLTKIIKQELKEGSYFNVLRLTDEIMKFLKEKHKVSFSTSRISDTLEELRKKGFIEKLPTNKKSKFQYRKNRIK